MQFSFISYVFYCFANFLCISLFLRLMYFTVFYMELFEYWISLNIKQRYCILELKMEFWHKKPFSIRFVHKSRKLSNFEPTFDYIMLCNLRTVRPIFPKIAPKVAQDFKEKSHESLRRGKKFPRNYRAKRRGGGGRIPFRVKTLFKWSSRVSSFIWIPMLSISFWNCDFITF